MVEKNSEKMKEMTIVSPVEDGLQVEPRLLASQPRIQDILSNMGIIFIRQLFRIRDKERSPLFLVLQTPRKSFMHSSLPRVTCGVFWELKSMS
jgi:hypothetical protein